MKYSFAIMLLISVVGITSFGAFSMHMVEQEHGSRCVFAQSQSVNCPQQIQPTGSLGSHLHALKNFFAVTIDSGLPTLLLFIALLAALLGVHSKGGDAVTVVFLTRSRRYPYSYTSFSTEALLRWAALHENSPSTA